MRSVLLALRPKWREPIVSGNKTIEVRKTAPKLKTPFKVYIYETQARYKTFFIWHNRDGMIPVPNGGKVTQISVSEHRVDYTAVGRGKVIGEFVCRGIMRPSDSLKLMAKQSCLSEEELHKYSGGKTLYGLRISDLKIYDKPKELGEFRKEYERDSEGFIKCGYTLCPHTKENGHYKYNCVKDCPDLKRKYAVKRPPQSWMYVQELAE